MDVFVYKYRLYPGLFRLLASIITLTESTMVLFLISQAGFRGLVKYLMLVCYLASLAINISCKIFINRLFKPLSFTCMDEIDKTRTQLQHVAALMSPIFSISYYK